MIRTNNQGNTFSMLTEILGPADSNRLREMSKPLTSTATTDIKDLPGNKIYQEKSTKYSPLDEISIDLDNSVFDSIVVSSFDEMDCFDIDINELIYCDQNSNSSSTHGHNNQGPSSNGSSSNADSAIGSVSQPLTPSSINRFQTQTPPNVYSNPYSNQPSSVNSLNYPPTVSSPAHKHPPPQPIIPQTREQKLQQLECMSKLLDNTNKQTTPKKQPVPQMQSHPQLHAHSGMQRPPPQQMQPNMPSPVAAQNSPRSFVSPVPAQPMASPNQMIARPQMIAYQGMPHMHPSDPRYRQYMMQMQQYMAHQQHQRAMMMQMQRQQYAQGMRAPMVGPGGAPPGCMPNQHPQMQRPMSMPSPNHVRQAPSPHAPSPSRPMSQGQPMQAPSPLMAPQGGSTVSWGKPQ